jgi:ComF family protein
MPLLFAALVLAARALPALAGALSRVLSAALRRLVAPPRCAACDAAVAGRAVFCAACAASVERVAAASREEIAFAEYGGALAAALRRFKYKGRSDLARPLGGLLRRAVRDARLGAVPLHDVDLVVPVPLHPRKLRRRGYNQVALLAAPVADELRVPLAARALVRARDTAAQASLDRAARARNIDGAFRVRSAVAVRGRHLVLVDDVRTTGATTAACRAALLGAGAARVTTVVLAVADGKVADGADGDGA